VGLRVSNKCHDMKFIYALRKTKAKECNNNRAKDQGPSTKNKNRKDSATESHTHTIQTLAKSPKTIKMVCQRRMPKG